MLLEELNDLLNEFNDPYYEHYKSQFQQWWDKVSLRMNNDKSLYKILRHWFLNNVNKTELLHNNRMLKLEAAGRNAIEWFSSKGGEEHANFIRTKFNDYGIPISAVKQKPKKDNNIVYITKPEAKYDRGENGYVLSPVFIKDGWALVKFSHWFNKETKKEIKWNESQHGEMGEGQFAIIQVPENVKMNSKIFLEGNGLADYSLGEIDIHTIGSDKAYFTSGHHIFDKSDKYASKEGKQFFAFIIRNKPELLPWFKIVRDKKTGKLKIKSK